MRTGGGKGSKTVDLGKNVLVVNVVGEALDGLEDLLFDAQGGGSLAEGGEFFDGQAGVFGDLTHEQRGDIAARVVGDGGAASVRVAVLEM